MEAVYYSNKQPQEIRNLGLGLGGREWVGGKGH